MLIGKHYKAIAEIIKTTQFGINAILASWMTFHDKAGFELSAQMWRRELAKNLANYFVKDNPRFDRDEFLKACGLKI